MSRIQERTRSIQRRALELALEKGRVDVNDLRYLVTETESVTGQRTVVNKALQPLVASGVLRSRLERVGPAERPGAPTASRVAFGKGRAKFYYPGNLGILGISDAGT